MVLLVVKNDKYLNKIKDAAASCHKRPTTNVDYMSQLPAAHIGELHLHKTSFYRPTGAKLPNMFY